jgi:hypothetical protein
MCLIYCSLSFGLIAANLRGYGKSGGFAAAPGLTPAASTLCNLHF